MSFYNATLFGNEIDTLSDVYVSRFVSLAGYTVLLFDLVLTLPHEISVVWTAKWSIVKILFLINRYTVPVVLTGVMVMILGLTPSLTTAGMSKVLAYYQVVALALVNVVVVLRIHALYRRRRDVFIILAALLALTYTATLYLETTYFQKMYPSIEYAPFRPFQICFGVPPPGFWHVWLPTIIFESIIWCMTAYKTWEHWYVDRLPFREAVVGDGIIYVTCAVCARLLVMLLWLFGTSSIGLMLFGVNFGFSLISVIGNRMLLNLPSVRSAEEWTEATDIVPYSDESFDHFDRKPTTEIWLADQGGQSFLEQIYQRTWMDATPARPTLIYMEKFSGA